MVYTDQMFNIAATATSLTLLQSGISTSTNPYNPPISGTLVRIDILMSGQTAASLIEQLRIELNCTLWIPNLMRFVAVGGAIRTAPAVPIPVASYVTSQPVQTAVGIVGNYLFNVAAVTPNIIVQGTFQ